MSGPDIYERPLVLPVQYPESDGMPLAETDAHATQMAEIFHALRARYHDRPDVYVAMDNIIYYEEGEPKKWVSPDLYVVLGIPKRLRRVYKMWEEGRPPDVVFEVSSKGTKAEDLGSKQGLYAYLGVSEYFLVDPLGEYLDPPVQGMRLGADGYARMIGEPVSEKLGLVLRHTGSEMRLVERATGRVLPTMMEDHVRAARAEAAEREVALLKDEIERLKR